MAARFYERDDEQRAAVPHYASSSAAADKYSVMYQHMKIFFLGILFFFLSLGWLGVEAQQSAPSPPQTYTFSFSAADVITISDALAELPWKRANPVIALLQAQVIAQQKQALAESEAKAAAGKPSEEQKQ